MKTNPNPCESSISWNIAFWICFSVFIGLMFYVSGEVERKVSAHRIEALEDEKRRDFLRSEKNKEDARELMREFSAEIASVARDEIMRVGDSAQADIRSVMQNELLEPIKVFLAINNGPVGVLLSLDGEWVYATDAVERRTGRTLAELIEASDPVVTTSPIVGPICLHTDRNLAIYDYVVQMGTRDFRVRIVIPSIHEPTDLLSAPKEPNS